MGKKLAIRGHSTQGQKVIKLLEMMGGSNMYQHDGEANAYSYYISGNVILHDRLSVAEDDDFEIFTLQEFLEKYLFKVGDKVIDEADGCPGVVCEMKWDEGLSDMKYCVAFGNGIDFGWFANDSINYFKIKKNENLEENKFPSFEPMFKMNDELEYKIPDGYEITEVSKDKVFIKPIKSKYPTTYEECCQHLGCNDKISTKKLVLFSQLINARNAYWKIAGEQMGLDEPWKPDWNNTENKFVIQCLGNNVEFWLSNRLNYILVFPTVELRDAFYENFKDLIEQCKELL